MVTQMHSQRIIYKKNTTAGDVKLQLHLYNTQN